MYYNFIYPDIRINPDYRFDEVMSGYNYNFSIVNNWQYSGATIGGVVLSGGSVIANTISATTYLGLPSSNFTGGTITGPTTFTNGLTTNSISATTYLGLPSSNFTGGTITGPTTFTAGLNTNSISATTYLGLPTDIRVTGGTYSAGTATFRNNTGGTFSVTGFTNPFTGGTVTGATTFTNGLTATSISATTYYGLPSTSGLYLPLSGGSVVGNTNITGVFRITGNTTTYGNLTSLGATSSYTATPLTINPGTYTTFLQKYYLKIHPESTNNFIPYFINDIGYLTLRGGSVTSNYTGLTQTQIETIFDGSPKYASFNPPLLGTGMTLNISFGENFNFTNVLAISFGAINWRAQDFIVELVSGGTYSTLDVVTGYTESDYLIEFSLPSPNTFDGLRLTFSNFFNTSSPTGFRIADISIVKFNSDGPKSLYVSRDGGAVYKPLSVTGATESRPSYSIYNDEDTGMYSPTANTLGFATNGTEKLRIDSTGRIGVGTKSPLFRLHVSGDTKLEGGLTATSISATTYLGLPTDIRVTGGTYSAGTATFTNNTGGTFSVTGFSTATTFTGGTVNGPTIFTNGLTATSISATSISATTYYNLPISPNYFLPLSGGTVTGGTIFQSGVTANTISQVDYIDFNVNPIVSNPTGGTLYFDATENALSYKPITDQNDVTINIGQESLIRIFNNTGTQINNGQALHITGSTSGSPTVSLANGAGGNQVQFQVSGIATHDIPNLSYGFMTFFGIVRDINLTAFTIGEQIYLSQTTPGGFAKYSDLSFTGRTCEIGHVIDNSTLGKLQVSILNEIEGTIITTQENNILAANNSSTGVFQFSGLTIDTPSGTTFSVGAAQGWIIDNVTSPANPNIQLITYPGSIGNPSLYYSSATETYILLTSASTITQQTTFPSPQQRRQNLYLGKFGHGTRQFLINAFNEPDSALSPLSQLRDMFTAVKLINDGVIASANGVNLNFNTSAGILYGLGIGYVTNKLNPNSLTVSGQSPTTFQYRTQTGGTALNTTLIDPLHYDINGLKKTIIGTKATNQRIYLLQNGQIRVQYGQTVYNQLSAAVAALQNETFVTFPNFRDNGILIGILSVLSSCTDLTDTSKAQFFSISKFGELIGAAGGTSTTTLQQAYNNSSQPEIVTNSTLGGLTIQNGTGNVDNVTNLFEGINTAGNTTSFVRADGYISAATVQTGGVVLNSNGLTATSISATTYLGLPTDIRVTGGTYSAGTATFTNNTGGTFSVTGFSTSSYGIVGISDSLGLYSYYSTFSSAMSAATSGQTIELFSDINETTNTTINLKNGVNINGNNHTYTLITTGTSNCFQDAGVAVNCSISNIIIKRLGGTASSTDTLCLYITGASNIKAYGTKLIGGTTNMRCLTINNAGAEVFGIYAEGYNPTITVTNGTLNDSTAKSLNGGGISVGASGKIIKCIGYGVNVGGISNAGLAIDSFGYDPGVQGFGNTGTAINCTGWSNGSGGFICQGGSTNINCNGYSTAQIGFFSNGAVNVISCKGYSSAGAGIAMVNGAAYDSMGFSTTSYGIWVTNSGGSITDLRSCKAISLAAIALFMNNVNSGCKIYNTEAYSKWNNAAGHGIVVAGNNAEIVQCTIEVTNASANSINATSALTTKYANNAFKGSLTAVTSNITQGMVNTHDAQGNILI
jgi:hypothetical protein